jgi:hypothetical protein
MLKRTLIIAAALLASLPLWAGEDSLDAAVYHEIATGLREAGVDLCEGTFGQAFEIRDFSRAPLGGGVIVTYTLVRYENCEEGAAFYDLPRTEKWTQVQGHWRRVILESKR